MRNADALFADLAPGRSAPPSADRFFESTVPQSGALRRLVDVGLEGAQGLAVGAKSIADLAGADNSVSQAYGALGRMIGGVQSPARRVEKARQAERTQAAEASGSVLQEIKAAGKNFIESPVSATVNALGSSAPSIIAAALGGPIAGIAAGAAQGVGITKGAIHDSVREQHQQAGMTPAEARARADAAQAYGAENTDQMAIAAALGGVSGRFGVERVASGAARDAGKGLVRRVAGTAAAEAIPEAFQGGHEALAANLAAQREYFDVPLMRGVAGQATAEALAGAGLGGVAGIAKPRVQEQPGADGRQDFTDTARQMGIDPSAGPMSKAAAGAVEQSARKQVQESAQSAKESANLSAADSLFSDLLPEHRGGFVHPATADAQQPGQATQDIQPKVAQPARQTMPFTEAGARRRAEELTQRDGQPYEVVPHPTVGGRFAAVPVTAPTVSPTQEMNDAGITLLADGADGVRDFDGGRSSIIDETESVDNGFGDPGRVARSGFEGSTILGAQPDSSGALSVEPRPAPDRALRLLMDVTDGTGNPSQLVGLENIDARRQIVAALTGRDMADIAPNEAQPGAVERLLYEHAGVESESLTERRMQFAEWLSDNPLPSIAAEPVAAGAPTITSPHGFRAAVATSMPDLAPTVDTLFERGARGEQGGVVLIESAQPADIAATVQAVTGRTLNQAGAQPIPGADGRVAGFYDPQSGLTFVIGPNVTPEAAAGVLLHEMTHGQQRADIDTKAQKLLGGRKTAPVRVRQFLDRVQARIDAAGAQSDAREVAAYIVEQAVTEGRQAGFSAVDGKFLTWVEKSLGRPVANLIRSFVAAVRAWGMKRGITPSKLAVDDLVAYARAGVKRAARGDVVTRQGAVQFSQANTDAAPDTPTVQADRLTVREWIGHQAANHRGWMMGALTRDQITDVYGKEMPEVARFDQVVQQMDAVRQRIAEKADALIERWRKLPAPVADRLADAMHRATIAGFDPDPHPATEPVHGEDAEILALWRTLPPDAQQVYRDVRNQYSQTLVAIRDGLTNRAEQAGTTGARVAAEIRLAFDDYLRHGPYFPLARFGDLLLIADKDAGRVVEAFESSAQREKRLRQLRADGWTVKAAHKAEYSATRDGAAGSFVGAVLEKIDALSMPADQKGKLMDGLNQLAITTLPDASYRRHFVHRKGTPGFSSDAMRAFASSMQHAAHHIAKIRHAHELALSLDVMQQDISKARGDVDVTEQQQVVNELSRRLEHLSNPNTHPIAAAAGQVGFVMSLGGSIASGLVNATQTPFVTLPWLGAKHGFGKASAALMRASKDYFGGKWEKWSGFVVMKNPSLTLEEKGALRQLEVAGLITLTQGHDLAGVANTDHTVSKRAWATNRAMKIVGWTFHVPEVFNRQVSALAAFRLAKEAGQSDAEAVEYARQTLIRTHFDYSASNRARFMQGNFTRVVTMFKQYSQQMTYLIWRNSYLALKDESPEVRREARRMLIGLGAMHFTAAGSLGLPLGLFGISPLLALLAMGMGDEDDPYDWETEYRKMLADTLGKSAGEAIAHGPLRMVLNVDLASRVGLGDLWIRPPHKEAEGRDLVEAWMLNLLGPVAGYIGQMGTAAKAFNEGKYARGVESMVPKFIASPLKGIRYEGEGVRSWRGDDLGIDLTPADILATAIGFNPAKLAEMYEGRSAVKGRESRLQDRRSEILNMWVASNLAGDAAGMDEAMSAAMRFSQKNPEFAINGDTFRQAYRSKMRNAAQIQDGIFLTRKREVLRNEGRFANTQ